MDLFYLKQPSKKGLDPNEYKVWENDSLPLGNGFFGASCFGYTNKERIQITENSLCNPYSGYDPIPSRNTGLQSFCDIYLDFNHDIVKNYCRTLSLDNSLLTVKYDYKNITYKREIFASYPDHVLVIRITASRNSCISFNVSLDLPFLGEHCVSEKDNFERTGKIELKDKSTIEIKGNMSFYNIDYFGLIKVINKGGNISNFNNTILVNNADEVVLIFSCGTNYQLESRVFLENENKKKLQKDKMLESRISNYVNNASLLSFTELFARHLEDYQKLYSRVAISFGKEENVPTDVLLRNYKNKKYSRHLEALLYQYGRYLLISSSRTGALPANLQGVWSAYRSSPWSCGYWHNINVQMNYWASNVSNLSEMFLSYSDYFRAFLPLATLRANDYINNVSPERFENDNNGFYVGTGAWPYTIDSYSPIMHSGPGTGAFTSLLFYDYYAFTGDKKYLKEVAYPIIYQMSVFLEKNLCKYGDKYLIKNSASPENIEKGGNWDSYHKTIGCAFDQQMVYENFSRTIELSKVLGIKSDSFISKLVNILPYLDPVLIGDSGQVKEYREEHKYGEFGELHHRHISQLVGLYPGTIINKNQKYEKAAEYTLNRRGDKSTGWATAHRLCLWARLNNPSRTMDILRNLISKNIMRNLWDKHPPFQIDGNFGYVAGVSEMLLQSHEGYINLLPCLPKEWKTGYFMGLKARGNHTVSVDFVNSKLVSGTIHVGSDSTIIIKNKNYKTIKVNGNEVVFSGKYINLLLKTNDIIEIK